MIASAADRWAKVKFNCNTMSAPIRIMTVMGLSQVFLISAGFLVTRALLKAHDKLLAQDMGLAARPVPSLSGWVSSYGLCLLLLPAVWCLALFFQVQRDGSRPPDDAGLKSGLGAIIACAVFFALSIGFAIDVLAHPWILPSI